MPWTTATTRATNFAVTAAVWNAEHVDNMNYLKEVAYVQFTAAVSVTATTEGTANAVVSAGAITYEAVPHLIEFYSPTMLAPTSQSMIITLFDSTTAVGRYTVMPSQSPASVYGGVFGHRLTPTAASHTYNVKAHVTGGTGSVNAGAGGSLTQLPGFIRIVRVPT